MCRLQNKVPIIESQTERLLFGVSTYSTIIATRAGLMALLTFDPVSFLAFTTGPALGKFGEKAS